MSVEGRGNSKLLFSCFPVDTKRRMPGNGEKTTEEWKDKDILSRRKRKN